MSLLPSALRRAAVLAAVVLAVQPIAVVAVSFALARRADAVARPAPAAAYEWPVDAPVADRFRPPSTPYAAGNRGIDFDTRAGQPVFVVAAGEVVFAGPVGRTLHIVVLHADGLRTSYSYLKGVVVRRGGQVDRGDVVGTAGETFHFGIRAGTAYLDPLLFLRPRALRPYLVRDDGVRGARREPAGGRARRWRGASRAPI